MEELEKIKTLLNSIDLDLDEYTKRKDSLDKNKVEEIYNEIQKIKIAIKNNVVIDNKDLDRLEFKTMKTNIRARNIIENKQEQIKELTKDIKYQKKSIQKIKMYNEINEQFKSIVQKIKDDFHHDLELELQREKTDYKNSGLQIEYVILFIFLILLIIY